MIRIDIIVSSADKIQKAFQKLSNLKQLQFIQVKGTFTANKQEIEVYFVFSKRITCKCSIRVRSYTVNEDQNDFLYKLAHASNFEKFKNYLVDRLCKLTASKQIYMPNFNPEKWTE